MRRVTLTLCSLVWASAEPLPRLEIDAGIWRAAVRGELQSGILPVDFHADLALRNATRFFGTARVRVAGRHRIVIEESPLQFEGRNLLSRTIVYNDREYRVEDTIDSRADLTYFFAGHQWDFLARDRGRLSLRTGAAYLGASGTISSASTGVSAYRSYDVGLPLAGFDGEAFLIGRWVAVHGVIQGMPLGGYGHYVQGAAGAGVQAGRVGLRFSYRLLNADVHERGPSDSSRAGVAPRMFGPVFSAVFRIP